MPKAKSSKKVKTNSKAIVKQEFLALMVQMRIDGRTFKEIAEFVGSSAYTVHGILTEEFNRRDAQLSERIGELRVIENERMDEMYDSLRPAIKEGNTDAIRAGLSIMQRRAKMMALDKPASAPVHTTPIFVLPTAIDITGTELDQPAPEAVEFADVEG